MQKTVLHGRLAVSVLLIRVVMTVAMAQAPPAASRTLIRAGHVLDVRSGKESADQTIIVTGDAITAISATSATPKQSQDREIDLRSMTAAGFDRRAHAPDKGHQF